MSKQRPQGRVFKCDTCTLEIEDPTWPVPSTHADAIDAQWQRSKEENPDYFNGTVFLMTGCDGVETGDMRGRVQPVDFKSYLYWRKNPAIDPAIRDVFGSAIVRARDGEILLGRQADGNLNAGLTYFPGGFIDQRDVTEYNTIDIAGSTAREIGEETGLLTAHLMQSRNYIVTLYETFVSVGVEFQANEPLEELQDLITQHIQSEEKPELTDVIFVADQTDLDQLALAPYAEVLLRTLLPETTTT